MNKFGDDQRPSDMRQKDLRGVAEYHAAGIALKTRPAETQRLIRLAINEAEALAAQTGVPELVLPTLAEEKVQFLRRWAARQRGLPGGRNEQSLAA